MEEINVSSRIKGKVVVTATGGADNAQNTAQQSKMMAELASGSSVSIEALEQSWQTIVKGIEEMKAIQYEMEQKRQDGARRLEVLKQDFVNRGIVQ